MWVGGSGPPQALPNGGGGGVARRLDPRTAVAGRHPRGIARSCGIRPVVAGETRRWPLPARLQPQGEERERERERESARAEPALLASVLAGGEQRGVARGRAYESVCRFLEKNPCVAATTNNPHRHTPPQRSKNPCAQGGNLILLVEEDVSFLFVIELLYLFSFSQITNKLPYNT